MTEQPELHRHNDTDRNLILNRALTDIERIATGHDPEVDVPINQGVWDRLDKMAQEIEARPSPAVAVKPLDWQQGTSKSDRCAHCECGVYAVAKIDGAWHAIRRFVDSEQQMEDEVIGMADNRALAMQDCEDDRDGRILSALSPQPPLSPQEAERLKAQGVIDGIEKAISKLGEQHIAGPFYDTGKDDDWRFRAKLARKEQVDADRCILRLLCDDAESALRAIAGGEGHE